MAAALSIARRRSRRRSSLQSEEDGSRPARSGDQARNPAQRSIAAPLILEPVLENDHRVSAAVPFATQSGPRFESSVGSKLRSSFPVELRGECIEAPFNGHAQPTLQAFLPVKRDPAQQQVSAKPCRRLGPV